ncbi:hypothetical protein [Hydrogenimonas thermophila]|uniref:hypothetical protein n=1 Tax=Hydrogenimonas thermophila TaxID=223786 RepID=UPI0011603993|nr:hypothetical protein [Hydrogenimonas thermophila]WOE69795.1 hypothetical protein RZR91_11880 [Hydrogenimonas thermophila]WOE72310.1 hypothetical protein RZR97_11875 [Hydrogenimonas thermophila]
MRKLIVLIAVLFTASVSAATVQCKIENERIYCTYHLDRSDNQNGKSVEFHWISPQSPKDDRIRHFNIPPRYGSVYDYRFLPGRAKGKWHVKVIDLDTNESVETAFIINSTDDSMFEED